jgi:hypothetical protein
MTAVRRRILAGLLLGATAVAGAQSVPVGGAPPGATADAPEAMPVAPLREDATWRATLERIAQGVVAI